MIALSALRLVVVCAVAFTSPAAADSVADFYHGKTISLYVSFPPGGGYDIYVRVLAPHFTRHIPGNPAIVINQSKAGPAFAGPQVCPDHINCGRASFTNASNRQTSRR